MDSFKKKYEIIYCSDDGEYRILCDVCDNLCIKRFYKNHLNSGTHNINFRKRGTIE